VRVPWVRECGLLGIEDRDNKVEVHVAKNSCLLHLCVAACQRGLPF
jgi:hypothetical protein